MNNASRLALRLLGTVLTAAALAAGGHEARAATLQYPDLQNVIPPADMSIVQNGSVREFRYTHDVYNAGPGPLEIQPVYSNTSGNYQGFEHIYSLASGNWSLAITNRVAGAFVFHAAHGHFHFPLAAFGLYAVAAGGGVGAPVAMSPKNGFCIDNSFLYSPNVPNAGAFLNHGPCTDPTTLRGLSVGYVDDYNYLDPGQAIPIDGLPDGTYWFRAIVDPNNYLAEGNESNNITDIKIRITGNVVQTFETTSPDSTPPLISMISPVDGDAVSGTIMLTSSTSTAGVVNVQYLLDGLPLGDAVTNGPDYAVTWSTASVADGAHWLAVKATDGASRTGTSLVVAVTVANVAPPPPTGDLTIDRIFSQDGSGSVTNAVSTSRPNQFLLAFVAADGPNGAPQTATVSGGGPSWTLVRRANSQNGSSEVWMATAANPLVSAPVSSILAYSNYYQSMTVVVFNGAAGIGAAAGASAASGAPQVQYTTTRDGSWGFGVGNDWDRAVARTLSPGQTMIHQYLAPAGDTFWVQSQTAPVPNAGTIASISAAAPTNDQWNLAAVEVLPAAAPAPDTTPPMVKIDNPTDGSTVSGIVPIAATAADTGGVRNVQFYVDNTPLGLPDTAPPFVINWDTTPDLGAAKTLTASATDLANNIGNSAQVHVAVDNSLPPPKLIGVDAMVFRDSKGILTTPSFSTATPNDLVVAFIAYDGPKNGTQTATVSGGGLTWSLVKRSNSQLGTAEIWSAGVAGLLSSKTVKASSGIGSYHGSLTVVAFTNAAGTGIAGASGSTSGQPNIYLPGIATGNWVWAVGDDWDNAIARTPVSGQVIVHQRLAPVGDTFWVQRTAAPTAVPGIVEIRDTAPTTDQWNYAAVEIVATHQ